MAGITIFCFFQLWLVIPIIDNFLINFNRWSITASDHITVWQARSFFKIRFLIRSASDHSTVSQTGFFSFFFSNTFSTLNVSDHTTVSQTRFKKTWSVRLWHGHWHLGVRCLRKKNWSDRLWYDHWGLLNSYGHWWVSKNSIDRLKKIEKSIKWSQKIDQAIDQSINQSINQKMENGRSFFYLLLLKIEKKLIILSFQNWVIKNRWTKFHDWKKIRLFSNHDQSSIFDRNH